MFYCGVHAANAVGNLFFIDGIMGIYQFNILGNKLNSSVQKLRLEGCYLFQQDNDSEHTAKLVHMLMTAP